MEKILLFVENFPHCSTASYDSIKHKFCHETKLRITFLVRPCNAFEQKNVTRCSPALQIKKKPLFKEDLFLVSKIYQRRSSFLFVEGNLIQHSLK